MAHIVALHRTRNLYVYIFKNTFAEASNQDLVNPWLAVVLSAPT